MLTPGTGKVRTYGKPAVGGPFSLVDEQGTPVTDASFPGKYLLIYFGFTYCPDICPSELVKIGKVLEKLGLLRCGSLVGFYLCFCFCFSFYLFAPSLPNTNCRITEKSAYHSFHLAPLTRTQIPESSCGIKDRVQPLFISLDGKRDSIAQMKQYKKGECMSESMGMGA